MSKQKITRRCIICGKFIKIKVDEKGKYDNGNYFGRIIPGKNKKMLEYWECNKCYGES